MFSRVFVFCVPLLFYVISEFDLFLLGDNLVLRVPLLAVGEEVGNKK